MKTHHSIPLLLVLMLLHGPAGAAQGDGRGAKTVAQRVAVLVPKLDHDDFRVRSAAALELKNLPGAAWAPVRAAMDDPARSAEARLHLESAGQILRARARNENRYNDLAWNRDSALAAYDAVGRRDPRWDAAARKGLRLFPRPSWNPKLTPEQDRARLGALAAAVSAGCDDPLVVYCYARVLEEGRSTERARINRLYRQAAEAIRESEYPAIRKCFVLARYGATLPGERGAAVMREVLDLIPAAADESGVLPSHIYSLARQVFEVLSKATTLREAYDDVQPVLDQALPGKPEPLLFQGACLARIAIEAPEPLPDPIIDGNGPPGAFVDPTEDGLAKAEEALDAAFEMDPTDARAALLMLNVLIDNAASPEEFDTWFRRAMAANPDSYDACVKKIAYLTGDYVEGHPEVLRFGRECLQGGNFYGRIPFILAEAHHRIAEDALDPDAYLRQPEVWEDVKTVYEGYLRLFPDHDWHLNGYAKWATQCGRWNEARQLFQKIGDRPDVRVWGNAETYEVMCETAAERADPEEE